MASLNHSVSAFMDESNNRKVLWLEVFISNKNPIFVAKFYFDAVTELKGVPNFVRRDKVPENLIVAGIKRF